MSHGAPVNFWTSQQDDRLRRMWDEGVPTVSIGAAMGVGKNAVIGRAHRIGLMRPSPIKAISTTPTGRPAWDAARTAMTGWALPAGHVVTTSAIGMEPWA